MSDELAMERVIDDLKERITRLEFALDQCVKCLNTKKWPKLIAATKELLAEDY
jgi:hypothetical protein